MGLFDTHAHPTDGRFDSDREQVLSRMRETGMLCMCVGADMESSAQSVALARENEGIYAAVGVHPHDAKTFTQADVPQLTAWLTQEPKVKALGEIGLDYYYDLSPRDVQRDVFARQLDLAYDLGKPVILHVRDAHGDTLDVLRAQAGRLPHCVLHCCSASWESAKVYLNLGCMISFAGPVTFKRSVHLQEVARNVPLDRLMVETDSPYLAPEPVRGRRNEPANVSHICRFIASLRDMDAQVLCDVTRENGKRFYGIA
ncbi:MAG TPA: TatD family hydrolase [Candidatus Ventricola gallistercoris]|nr:TatD family hydrolase [Candidatus Ventricola gallistercoris]